MKRLFVIFVFLGLLVFPCAALEKPRWVGAPIYVYIPEYGQMSDLMQQAFEAWEHRSKKLVRFKFVNPRIRPTVLNGPPSGIAIIPPF